MLAWLLSDWKPSKGVKGLLYYDDAQLTADLRIGVSLGHRFSTVRLADHISVIENGGIIENGSHEELIALDGRYAQLFNLQAEAYR